MPRKQSPRRKRRPQKHETGYGLVFGLIFGFLIGNPALGLIMGVGMGSAAKWRRYKGRI
jgi:uncharacterized membrane protein